jgi:hypothetical protein
MRQLDSAGFGSRGGRPPETSSSARGGSQRRQDHRDDGDRRGKQDGIETTLQYARNNDAVAWVDPSRSGDPVRLVVVAACTSRL